MSTTSKPAAPAPSKTNAAADPKGAAKPARRRGAKKGKRRKALKLEEPHRMCIVCRASKPQPELLRFARSVDGAVGFDVKNRLQGIGAWVCATSACLNKALDPKQGGFARAFDAPVVFEAAALRAQVLTGLDAEVKNALGLMRRQGSLVPGREDVIRRASELLAVGLASDLSENSRHEVAERVPELQRVVLPPMAELGQAIGMQERPAGVVGIPKFGGAGLLSAIARWQGVKA